MWDIRFVQDNADLDRILYLARGSNHHIRVALQQLYGWFIIDQQPAQGQYLTK